MSSVDLPTPGSPAISSTEPRTKPPPVTRSSSAMPDLRRGASCVSPPASGSSAKVRPLRGSLPGPAGRAPMPPPAPSSTSVFHSPQASHLPCQRLVAAPQFWQTNERLRFDISLSRFDELHVAACVELGNGNLAVDRGERPDVPERIDDGGNAVAPVGVLDRRDR